MSLWCCTAATSSWQSKEEGHRKRTSTVNAIINIPAFYIQQPAIWLHTGTHKTSKLSPPPPPSHSQHTHTRFPTCTNQRPNCFFCFCNQSFFDHFRRVLCWALSHTAQSFGPTSFQHDHLVVVLHLLVECTMISAWFQHSNEYNWPHLIRSWHLSSSEGFVWHPPVLVSGAILKFVGQRWICAGCYLWFFWLAEASPVKGNAEPSIHRKLSPIL